jgi:hypothetical protein
MLLVFDVTNLFIMIQAEWSRTRLVLDTHQDLITKFCQGSEEKQPWMPDKVKILKSHLNWLIIHITYKNLNAVKIGYNKQLGAGHFGSLYRVNLCTKRTNLT